MQKRKQGLALLLLLTMLVSVLAVPVWADETVYSIKSAQDLVDLGGRDLTGVIELCCDLDMAGQTMESISSFSGIFRGNGYAISNLKIEGERKTVLKWNDPYQGLGLISVGSGRVEDLVLEQPQIQLQAGQSTGVAALIGSVTEGESVVLKNCAVVGGQVQSASEKTTHVGALVGNLVNGSLTISGCFSTADISYTGSKQPSTCYAGGLIGYVSSSDVTVENSAVLGNVASYSGTSGYAGGMIGIINGSNSNKTVSFTHCYMSGAVTGGSAFAFIYTGKYSAPVIQVTDCYYNKEVNSAKLLCFGEKANVTGTVTGINTVDFAALSLGEGFQIRDGFPLPAWYGAASSLTVTVQPEDAQVTLTDEQGTAQTAEQAGNAYTYSLTNGTYTLSVTSQDGEWIPQTVPVVVGKGTREVSVSLKRKTYPLHFAVTPREAQVQLRDENGFITPREDGSYQLVRGSYSYEVTAFGYESAQGEVKVPEEQEVTLSLKETPRYEVRFFLYPASAGGKIQVTNGDTGLVMQGEQGRYRLPEGVYDYQITADGYRTRSGSFAVPGTEELTVTLIAGSSWDGEMTESLSGKGTQEEPYQIRTAGDLARMAQQVNEIAGMDKACYSLEADLDLGYLPWTPVGKTSVAAFRGIFLGNGHQISGLNVSSQDRKAYAYYGLFGCLTDATVKNLTVCGEIYCDESTGLSGGLAGAAVGNTVIEGCAGAVSVSAQARSTAGGLVGLCRKSDEIGYQWLDNTVRLVNCLNRGDVLIFGEDRDPFSQGTAGGLVGYSKNCVQFENCANTGAITGANLAAGICGNMGSAQGDHCHPFLNNCYNSGKISGKMGAYPIYGKNHMAQQYVTGCYTFADCYAQTNSYVTETTGEELTGLLGDGWSREEQVNGGLPYPAGVRVPPYSDELSREAAKYADLLSIPADAKVGDVFSLLTSGAKADEQVQVRFVPTESNYLTLQRDGLLTLKQTNETGAAVTETLTLQLTGDAGRLRRKVTVVIYPSSSARVQLMDRLAGFYGAKTTPSEWVVFDMAAYNAMGGDKAALSEAAKQNYINLAIDELHQSYALATDRAKGEVILGAIGVDTAKLYPVNSKNSFHNGELLRKENFGSSYTTAVWTLLADLQGNVKLSKEQIGRLVKTLRDNQKENGLFGYSYMGNDYTDVDSTGWALAALARFVLSKEDSWGVQAEAQSFVDRALTGLSAELRDNASYGTINSDAMVITGLAALGIDPGSDRRFVKNGCTLADAPMLYVNSDGTGFISAYAEDSQGNQLSEQATEQGFRGLVCLEAFEKYGKKPYQIYAFPRELPSGEKETKVIGKATGKGSVELPPEPSETADNLSVELEIKDGKKTWLNLSMEVKEGATVYHALKKAAEEAGITVIGLEKGYVKGMSYQGTTLSEFDRGENSGWLFSVNGTMPEVGITDYTLHEGDRVVFQYTEDYTKDSHMSSGSSGGGSKPSPSPTPTAAPSPSPEPEWSNPFTDVPADAWYYETVRKVTVSGLFHGVTETLFAPDEPVTRGMFVTLLYRMEQEPEAKSADFTDVPTGAWYEKAVNWAAEQGVVYGVSETLFAPDEPLTREQLAAMLYRYAKAEGETDLSGYEDAASVSPYALPAMKWAVAEKLLTGKTALTLNPQEVATRAETAAILIRYQER